LTGGTDPLPSPVVSVVSVGDELLFGQTVDTNGFWLSRELSFIGMRVLGRWVVGDVEEEIRQVVRGALDAADLVLVTGGLGPTPDDLTREAVAGLLGRTLSPDPDLLKGLQARFRTRGFGDLPKRSRSMAMVPEGGRVLRNPHGAAPGMILEEVGGGICVLLPGVPREMKGIFEDGVKPYLEGRFSGRLRPAVHKVIHTFGVPESILMAELQGIIPDDAKGVSLAYLPDQVGVRLRLTAWEDEEVGGAAARLGEFEEILEPVLSRYRFEAESGDLAEAVGAALRRSGNTLAVAESCTGGLISKRLTDVPGSSGYFLGGVVAYANDVKEGVLGVDEALVRQHGVVSEDVARAMALGVVQKLHASAGLGVTGVAGPGGGSPEKPVGTVFYAATVGGRTVVRRELFLGDREAVRERAAHATLGLLLRLLEGREA
jgi:nicotinamide-nucleotide amidase